MPHVHVVITLVTPSYFVTCYTCNSHFNVSVSMDYHNDTAPRQKFRLTYETVNSRVVQMEYAVRGLLPQEAKKIEADIRQVSVQFRIYIYTHTTCICTHVYCVVGIYLFGIS